MGGTKFLRDRAEGLTQASRGEDGRPAIIGVPFGNHDQKAERDADQTTHGPKTGSGQCSTRSVAASVISRRSFSVIPKDTWKPSGVRSVTMCTPERVLRSISQPASG